MYRPKSAIVLVVEDNPVLLLNSVDLIADAGFEVLEASNADEAIEILQQRTDIAIVFTDIEMPGSMDGLKLAQAVRDGWPPVHLVIASGRHTPEPDEMPAGSRFFSKPFKGSELVATLREMAEAPRHTC